MGYFKIKKRTDISKNYEPTYSDINEYEIANRQTEVIKEPEKKDISIDLPKNVKIKKGSVVLNDHLKYFKPNNLSANEDIFDNRFIGVQNERTEKIAVLVHCYFIDVLIHTVLPKLLPLSKYADFYFNFIKNDDTVNQAMAIEVIKRNFDNYTINYTDKNIGRDINGQFNNLNSIYKNNKSYDFYLLVHTKKSKHLIKSAAKNWVDDLLLSTVGDYNKINQILDDFNDKPKLGVVGSKTHKHKTLEVMFSGNRSKYNEICEILNIDKNTESYFIGGTFFWVRSEIIDHYFKDNDNLKIISDKFDETGLLDGDWHHAMERIFGTLCYSLGYVVNDE
jgi:lipopolysaccharide biosynthesis protein